MPPTRIWPGFPLAALLGLAAGAISAEPLARLSAPPEPMVAPAKASTDLLLPGDLLHVEVYENADLTSDIRVPVEGTVPFPLIGQIAVLPGTSCELFARQLQERLESRYLTRALVTVTVTEYGARRIYVMGGVAKPGALTLNAATPASAIRALGEAGGLSEDADRRSIVVVREDGRGGSTALPVQIDGAQPLDVALQPNDLVLVSRLDRIYVTGQVKLPGSVPSSRENLTVARAISLVGGFDKYARMSQVQLLRAGQPVRVVDVVAILAGDGEDPALLPGDMINVPERRF